MVIWQRPSGRRAAPTNDADTTGEAGQVKVLVEKQLPLPPDKAYEAFLKYVWLQGGGILALCVASLQVGSERTFYPILLKEELVALEPSAKVHYRVTQWGPLFHGLSDHSGSVSFEASGDSTVLKWHVQVRTSPAWTNYWTKVVNYSIDYVASNLEAVLRRPILEVCVEQELAAGPAEALQAAVDFIWRRGGNLPVRAPAILAEGDPSTGEGLTRRIWPVGLVERIRRVSLSSPALIEYSVENPGFFTMYPVAVHWGSMEFQEVGPGRCKLVWKVQCFPLLGCRTFVQALTSYVISTLSRNLAKHLQA